MHSSPPKEEREGGREGGRDAPSIFSPSVSHPQDLHRHPRGPNPIVDVHTGNAGSTGIQHSEEGGKTVLPYPITHAGRHRDDGAGEEAWKEEEEKEKEGKGRGGGGGNIGIAS